MHDGHVVYAQTAPHRAVRERDDDGRMNRVSCMPGLTHSVQAGVEGSFLHYSLSYDTIHNNLLAYA